MNEEDADALLAAVLCGEIAEHDPRVVALLREQPWRKNELAAARAAQATVQAANELRQATLASARRMPAAPGEERLPQLMAQHVAELHRPPAHRWRKTAALVALAAVLLLGLQIWFRPPAVPVNQPPQQLGSAEVMPLSPVGELRTAAWPTFRWQGEADSYRVVVFRPGGGRRSADEICASPIGIVGHEWQPDAEASAKLTAQTSIEWELQFQDANGGGVRLAAAVLAR